MKRFIILVMLLCLLFTQVALGTPRSTSITNLGDYTGPLAGTGPDDNIKAELDDIRKAASLDGSAAGTGSIFYVDSDVAAAAGTSWATAVGTIDAAVNLCTGDRGDVIFVAAGHAETLTAADGVDCDAAGITIVGLGVGESRPTLTYTTNGEFVIGADDVAVHNIVFIAGNAVTHAIDVETGFENFVINNCRFLTTTVDTDEFTDCIDIAATSDNGKITNNHVEMGAASAVSFVTNVGADYTEISGNFISGDFSTANIVDVTTASIWLTIKDNILVNGTVGGVAGLNTEPAIELKSDSSAIITGNTIFCNVAAPELSIVAADGLIADNTYSEFENAGGSVPVGKSYAVDALAALGIANTGTIFYCDSGETSTVEDGLTWGTATDTLDEAINLCTDAAGDVIFVAPGHTETFTAADGFDLDLDNVTVIGLGRGMARPQFLFNHTDAEVAVSPDGDNCTIKNIIFLTTIDSVKIGLDIEAAADYVTVEDCLFWEQGDATGTDEFDSAIRIGNACSGTTIQNCEFRAEAAEAISAIHSDNDTAYTTIKNNTIIGDYSSGCVNFITVASTDLHIIDNILVNGDLVADGGLNAVASINCVDATAGLVKGNHIASDVATGLLMRVADDMVFLDNWITDDDGDEFDGGTASSSATIAGHTDG